MPANVRPSWIDLTVAGRSNTVNTGPASRAGDMYATLSVRNNGAVLRLLDIDLLADGDTVQVVITDKRNGNVIFDEAFRQ